MSKSVRFLLPLIVFAALVVLLVIGLGKDPSKVPSPLIDKPVPEFSLPELTDPNRSVDHEDLKGQISLVNVWASWCASCRQEHEALMALAKDPDFQIVGLNWKDEAEDARAVLEMTGNPYAMIGHDPNNRVGLHWGVYGAPETFLVDQQGIIRYKHIGPIDRQVWEKTLKPLVAQLKAEG
ncbi:MAG: DsbE family thiol:disulfide interchange protein [Halochromatium sp.]|uniref:DsbE family thiol:disulfide interchange protein n=1 Tax=Halochromatium sp. TaxID=2049430 RepID=UPI0039788573